MTKRHLKFAILVVVVAVLSGFLLFAQVRSSIPFFARLSVANSSPLSCTAEDVLLVVAPHCDDEVFGAGGFIYDAVKQGAKVYVVVVTNGEAFRLLVSRPSRALLLGDRRQRETLEALGVLGIPKDRVFFLGYPDRGLELLWYEHWLPGIPYFSCLTRREFTPDTSFRPGSPYCGKSVVADLEEILRTVRPTLVLTASPFDTHPDHRAVYNFTMYALERLRYEDPFFENTRVFWFLVHWNLWPHGSLTGPGVKLIPPRELLVPTIQWQYYFLGKDTVFAKMWAVRKYRSQSAGGYPLSFIRANELFVEARKAKMPTLFEGITVDGRWDDWGGPNIAFSSPEVRIRQNGARRTSSPFFLAMAKDAECLYLAVHRLSSKKVTYRFHFLPVTPLGSEETYVDVEVGTGGRKTIVIPSEDEFPGALQYALGDDGLEVAVPLELLHHAATVFFRMEVLEGKRILAETIWKVLTF
ncbi:PIG-L deacetylase family protein [Candidatus Caldatribacterium sp. SIUC1]|uniref:PIG-L deacetylase family protein n=1 Tax=Candidatus Caldatribacterium sp. SIUC1 TaxID=3418365 RepID=UPI003F68F982